MDAKSIQEAYLLESPIQKLNYDCLIQIFNHLTVVDRIRIERVSKQWQEIAKKSWNGVKILKKPTSLGFKSGMLPKVNDYMLEEILKRCGKYLTNAYFEYHFKLSLIVNYCPNIQSILCVGASKENLEILSRNAQNLSTFSFRQNPDHHEDYEDSLANLFSKSKNLKDLSLQCDRMKGYCLLELPLEEMTTIVIVFFNEELNMFEENLVNALKKTAKLNTLCIRDIINVGIIAAIASSRCTNLTKLDLISWNNRLENVDKQLAKIFHCNRNLKFIYLRLNYSDMTGECLLSLNKSSVEEIKLFGSSFPDFQVVFLIKSLPTFKNLHYLKLSGLRNQSMRESEISKCIRSCLNLKTLELSEVGNNHDSPEILIKSISELKNLESLSLGQILSTNFCDYISANLLKLKVLTLKCCRNLSDIDLELLHELPNLEVLDICFNSNITGLGIRRLSNLKKLSCFYCKNLEDEGLIKLLKCVTNLEYLDLRKCDKITNAVIDAAIDVTKVRTNNIELRMAITGTSININKIQGASSLLVFDENMPLLMYDEIISSLIVDENVPF